MTRRSEEVAQELERLVGRLREEFIIPMVPASERRLRHSIALLHGAIDALAPHRRPAQVPAGTPDPALARRL